MVGVAGQDELEGPGVIDWTAFRTVSARLVSREEDSGLLDFRFWECGQQETKNSKKAYLHYKRLFKLSIRDKVL